jgi:hypothetical protein
MRSQPVETEHPEIYAETQRLVNEFITEANLHEIVNKNFGRKAPFMTTVHRVMTSARNLATQELGTDTGIF